MLADFLARENLCVDEALCRSYDHEVKALTIVKPFVGREQDVPSDASVFQVSHKSFVGYALAEGVFPTYSDLDAHAMAQAGVDLAVRRVIASGARPDRIAALDNYCWPDPLPGSLNPDAAHKAAQLVRASRGLSEICIAYGVPLISGKDSMKNDAVIGGRRISIPPTLLASVIAIVEDVRQAMTLEPRGVGERLMIVGGSEDELGGSEWATRRGMAFSRVPRCQPEAWAARYRSLAALISEGLVSAAHAPGRGGLGPALFRMALAARCGVEVDLSRLPAPGDAGWEARLFGESCGRMLLACSSGKVDEVLDRLETEPVAEIGSFTESPLLRVRLAGRELVRAEMGALEECWKTGLAEAPEAGR